MTDKRLAWVCDAANGATTASAAADGIHAALAGNPPYEPVHGDLGEGWELLDPNSNTYGECDEQARLMALAMQMLGETADVSFVRASTNAGAGNCLDLEDRTVGGEKQWLILYMPDANAFEACCVTPPGDASFYAVWPSLKADDDYGILVVLDAINTKQWWVQTLNDIEPGDPGWRVVAQCEGPIPVP